MPLFCCLYSKILKNRIAQKEAMEVFIMENIIFGIMVLIAVGAGIVTCIYEVGGSSRANVSEQSIVEQNNKNE